MIIKCICGGNMRITKEDFETALKGKKFSCYKCRVKLSKDAIEMFLQGKYYIQFKNAEEQDIFMKAIDKTGIKSAIGVLPSNMPFRDGQPCLRVRLEREPCGIVWGDIKAAKKRQDEFGIKLVEFDTLKI